MMQKFISVTRHFRALLVFLHSRTHGSFDVGVELGGVGLLVVLGPVELLHVGLEVDGVTRRGEKTSGPPSLAIGM